MPFVDLSKKREIQARWYREKYQSDPKFQTREAARKAAWLQTEEGRESNAVASARARKAAKKKRKRKKSA